MATWHRRRDGRRLAIRNSNRPSPGCATGRKVFQCFRAKRSAESLSGRTFWLVYQTKAANWAEMVSGSRIINLLELATFTQGRRSWYGNIHAPGGATDLGAKVVPNA